MDGWMDAKQWMMRHSPCMRGFNSESESASSLTGQDRTEQHAQDGGDYPLLCVLWADLGLRRWLLDSGLCLCWKWGTSRLSGSGLDGHGLLLSRWRLLTTGAPCRCGGRRRAGRRRSGYRFLRRRVTRCYWNAPYSCCSRCCDGDRLHGLAHRHAPDNYTMMQTVNVTFTPQTVGFI